MAPQTSFTILVIDDDPGIVSGLSRLLRRDGHTVETADNGHQALERLREHHYDVILCDLRMPAGYFSHRRYLASRKPGVPGAERPTVGAKALQCR